MRAHDVGRSRRAHDGAGEVSVRMKRVDTVGELRYLLAGIPENIPLRIVAAAAETADFYAGYGTDPRDLKSHIFVMDVTPPSQRISE